MALSFLKKNDDPGAITPVTRLLLLLTILRGLVSLFTNIIDEPADTLSVAGLKDPPGWMMI